MHDDVPTLARTRRSSIAMWLGIASVLLLGLPLLYVATGFAQPVLFRALVIVMPASLPLGLVAWATARRGLNTADPDEIAPSERAMLRCGVVCGLTGTLASAAALAVFSRLWYAILLDAG